MDLKPLGEPINEFDEFEEIEQAKWLRDGLEGAIVELIIKERKNNNSEKAKQLRKELDEVAKTSLLERENRIRIINQFPAEIKRYRQCLI
jgi:hypothetical protein